MTSEPTATSAKPGATSAERDATSAEPGSGTQSLISSVPWLLRAIAYVVVSIVALEGRSSHGDLVISAVVVVGVLLVVWGAIDVAEARGHHSPVWLLTIVLAGMGVVAGFVTALPGGAVVVTFAIVAGVGAGSDLPFGLASTVAAASILAIEVGYLAFGFNSGDVGFPLALAGGVLLGRNRRDARVQSAQAVALFEQSERTHAEERRATMLDERARIAREIHDLLAHSLGALGIQLQAAVALLTDASDIDRALPLLEQARRLASNGLEDTRQAIEALRTNAPPLPESLRSLVEGHVDQYRTPVDLAITGAPHPLSPDASLALFRVAHEALVNAAKHAPSARIALTLEYGPDETTVSVTNDSTSGQPSATVPTTHSMNASGGYGLAGMRERLLLMGGTLTAGQMTETDTESDPGWIVRARIPND